MKKTITIILLSCLLTSFTVRAEEFLSLPMNVEKSLANHPSNVENKNFIKNSDKTISEKNKGKVESAMQTLYSILHPDFYHDLDEDDHEHEEIIPEIKLTREDCDIPEEDDLEPLPIEREEVYAQFYAGLGRKYENSVIKFKVINISDNEQGYIDAEWRDVLNPNKLKINGTPAVSHGGNDFIPDVVSALNTFLPESNAKVENGYILGQPNFTWSVTGSANKYKLVKKIPSFTEFKVIKMSDDEVGYENTIWKDIFKKDSLNVDGTPKENLQESDLHLNVKSALYKAKKDRVQVEQGEMTHYNGNFKYMLRSPEPLSYILVMKRSYISELEYRKRRYWRSLRRVECFNKLGLSWKKGISVYSDFTVEEKKALFASGSSYLKNQKDRMNMLTSTDGIYSDQKNTNTHDSQTQSVRHQTSDAYSQYLCANSWAYAATSAIEGAYYNKTKIYKRFSPIEMTKCVDNNLICDGNSPANAYRQAKTHGVQLEEPNVFTFEVDNAEYSYPNIFNQKPNVDQTCREGENKFEKLSLTKYFRIRPKDNDELKAAVAQQPVSVGVVGSELLEYSNGIIDQNSCKDDALIDHSVLIVGYDHKDGKDYWIVKNSWGRNWGEDYGFMYVERQQGESRGTCGIALDATYPVVEVMD